MFIRVRNNKFMSCEITKSFCFTIENSDACVRMCLLTNATLCGVNLKYWGLEYAAPPPPAAPGAESLGNVGWGSTSNYDV